jgi:hypothetical protein
MFRKLAQIPLCICPISAKLPPFMSENALDENNVSTHGPKGYRVSNGPIVRLARSDSKLPPELAGSIELPRVYGAPLLFAIARDPRTLFVYWNIDWSAVFESTAPVDRQVHLRVYRADGSEELIQAVEPMAGNCYLNVAEAVESYRVEIGYFQPEAIWNSVAISEQVTTPAERVGDSDEVDVATIPFHLSFQRLIDNSRCSNANALSEIISRLQQRAVSDEDRALLTDEEREILRAMNLSIDQIVAGRRAFGDRQNGAALRRRAEALLGFGASSPSRAFGESS